MLWLTAALLSGLLFQAVPAPPPEQNGSVKESVESVLVEVPVRVTDRHGNPVRGLEAKDFEVFDDGKKQQILALDTIDLARKSLAPSETEPVPPAARRHFLLLFDFSFAHPKSILAAQRASKEFVLNGLAPADFVGVATYSVEHGLRLLTTFTPDRVQVSRAIDTLGLMPTEDLSRDPLALSFDIAREHSSTSGLGLKESTAAAISETIRTLLSLSRARFDQYARTRVHELTEALRDLASTLDSVSGRKDIVYLSEGFESRLVVGTRDTEEEREWIISGEEWKVDGDKRFGNPTLKEDLRLVGEQFRRSDCVLHAVDIAGLRLDPETTAMDPVGAENSLFELANPTGGEVLRSANDFRSQFKRLEASTSLVYVLSFRPQRSGEDSRYHALKVKVRRPGANVLARAGYYERPSFRMLSPLERSLLAADVIMSDVPIAQISASLRASPLPDEKGPARVPVLIEMAGPDLLVKQQGSTLPIEIYVYAHDASGQLRDFFTQNVTVDLGINRERLESRGLRYYGQLTLQPGTYKIRALVRHAQTGRMGLASETVRVPDFTEKQPYVAPPLFLDSASAGLFVRGRVGEAGRAASGQVTILPAGPDLVPAALPE
ncbi:MAG TPA: VWA domain-containing protein, partial [Thermoanaerobaculia bacterium]|nr:VWA domain-containing protein [Thermoanaerobaculia bacterium]